MKHFISFETLRKHLLGLIAGLLFHLCGVAQTQSLTARPDRTEFGIGIGGYYESLPIDYSTNPSRKYPLLIALHGSGERGSGSSSQLPDVLTGSGVSVPELINSGNFPDSFTVDGQTFSFIVICPQLRQPSIATDSLLISMKRLVEYCKANYRVDASRVYMTGLSFGANMQWSFASKADDSTGLNVTYRYPDSLAAIVSVSTYIFPSSAYSHPSSPNIIRASTSNLPVFAKHNNNDATAGSYYSTGLVNSLNGTTPVPSPLARYTLFYPGNSHDAWTVTYDPDYIFDSIRGFNMYEWMLQFTNKKLSINAGHDTLITFPVDSITLDGSKSRARGGRINSHTWTKISGPSAGTIVSPNSAVTKITNLLPGEYQFVLKITHTNLPDSLKDTVSVSVISPVQTQTLRPDVPIFPGNIDGFVESLPVTYGSETTKKFPLLIYLHGGDARGNGSEAHLVKVLNDGIPKMIEDSLFPSSFNVHGENFSFIVISPQLDAAPSNSDSITIAIMKLIKYCKSNYRVDPERIYITGGSYMGGQFTWNLISRDDEVIPGDAVTTRYADSIAAALIIAPYIYPASAIGATSGNIARVNASNLPLWGTHNSGDTVIPYTNTVNIVNRVNALSPAPSPLARYTLFSGLGNDAWTATYNPSYILDSANGFNAYQWMLQYTNKKLFANAGFDTTIVTPTSSVTLRGNRSTARAGRITAYQWTKISGGSATIVSSTSATTNVTGLSSVGTYIFELQVTHSNSSTARDTVVINVSSSSPRIAMPITELPSKEEISDKQLEARIIPTVAQSQINILIAGKAKGKTNIVITDMGGKRFQRQSFMKDESAVTRTMNISSLPGGVYIVEIVTAGKYRKVLKFVKQ